MSRDDAPRRGWLPGRSMAFDDHIEDQESGDSPRPKIKQVGVRLSWRQYGQLRMAADLYGVTPTTMARMLINRGSKAVVNSYYRDELG